MTGPASLPGLSPYSGAVAGLEVVAYEAGMITATLEPTVVAFLSSAAGYAVRNPHQRGDVALAMCVSFAAIVEEAFARFNPAIINAEQRARCLEVIAERLRNQASEIRQAEVKRQLAAHLQPIGGDSQS